jgi:hypothetical protein
VVGSLWKVEGGLGRNAGGRGGGGGGGGVRGWWVCSASQPISAKVKPGGGSEQEQILRSNR